MSAITSNGDGRTPRLAGSCRNGARLKNGLPVIVAAIFCLTPATRGQFRSQVETVLVRVTVTTSSGAPVAGLQRQDFRLTSDGQARELTYFEGPGGPIAVLLVLDSSSSMEGESSRLSVEAARRFVGALSDSDELGLVSFDQVPRLRLDLGPGIERMHRVLETVPSRGGTALYDAIALGYQALLSSSLERQVLLVLSDGLEQDSSTTFAALDHLVASRNVVFASVSWLARPTLEFFQGKGRYFKPPELEENLNPVWVLNHLATTSGGESLFPADAQSLLLELRNVADRLRNSYLIGFEPAGGGPELREIEVRIPAKPGLRVEHRSRFSSPGPERRDPAPKSLRVSR